MFQNLLLQVGIARVKKKRGKENGDNHNPQFPVWYINLLVFFNVCLNAQLQAKLFLL